MKKLFTTTVLTNGDTDTYSAAVNAGTQQRDALADGRNVVIDLPSIPNVNNYTLGIPDDYLSGTTSDGSLTLNTDAGSMTLPSNMLTGVPGMSGSKVEITNDLKRYSHNIIKNRAASNSKLPCFFSGSMFIKLIVIFRLNTMWSSRIRLLAGR